MKTGRLATSLTDSRKKSIRDTIIVLSFVAISSVVAFWIMRWWVDLWIGPTLISGNRIGMASLLVMQIDSFLAAGWVIGFFQFQGVVSKMIRQIARLKIAEEIALPEEQKTLGVWHGYKGLSYFAGFRFPIVMLVIVVFVFSGLYSVRATLFETRDELVTSIALLVEGLVLMVVFWFGATSQTELMAARIGEGMYRKRTDSPSSCAEIQV
jgi:preprotein translocase subunit SecE